ncbi:MAG: acetolactate synthase [Solirubrobacterales bacterium]|nr:acetolactate synthase [Solirubrobacterales bacterium]
MSATEETGTKGTEAELHGGRLVARRLKAYGVSKLFTLSGGHIFSIFDGCRDEGIDIVDVRHEQTAVFAAEGWAKVTREPGVAALTAGPGVTNGMSGIAGALMNRSPILVLGGRAPQMRWGMGSLQEIDHIPFVDPLVKFAGTPMSTVEIPGMVDQALNASLSAPSGPTFLDFPMDFVFQAAPDCGTDATPPTPWTGPAVSGSELDKAIDLLKNAERPAVMAGTNLWWGRGEVELLKLCEEIGIPAAVNGMARGSIPADSPIFRSRARSATLQGADVALVIGVPMDFRLGFGASFGPDTKLIVLDVAKPGREHPREVAAELYGAMPATLAAIREGIGGPLDTKEWLASTAAVEAEKRAAEDVELNDSRAPLHPMRLYKELANFIDRDAIVVVDAGDFGSYAGRVIDSYVPGSWLDPGPYGCLGAGPGQALAAKLAHPDRQVVLLLGDGAFGFSGMEFDTLVRHGVQVVGVMGNNGIWALEKHPMEFLYGYSVAADLQPELRYDKVVEALGGHAELVSKPDEMRPALERAFSSGKPALVNVLTDPTVVYPRRSNLA